MELQAFVLCSKLETDETTGLVNIMGGGIGSVSPKKYPAPFGLTMFAQVGLDPIDSPNPPIVVRIIDSDGEDIMTPHKTTLVTLEGVNSGNFSCKPEGCFLQEPGDYRLELWVDGSLLAAHSLVAFPAPNGASSGRL